MTIRFEATVPTFRIFSVEKAREFYLDFLGFNVDWEHRFDDNAPLLMQVSKGSLVLFLSEHHGDGCPGAHITAYLTCLDELHAQLTAKRYRYYRPGIQEMPWNVRVMAVIDPFGNRIHFTERTGAS